MSEQRTRFTDKQAHFIIIVILSFYPLVGMGVDLIAPSLPAISESLKTTSSFSKNLVTIYLLGLALGNFFIGFISDALGRRKLIFSGFVLFTLASLLPAIFPKPGILLFARFLQGFTLAAFGVLGRAVFSDVVPKEKLIHYATFIATMWGIGPIIGPVIGGYLQFYFNWQACFYFYALFGLSGSAAIFLFIPETHTTCQPLQFTQLKNNFISIITHRFFLGIVILMGISYSLLIVFNTLGPFLIQSTLGYSPVYFGHAALFLGLTFLIATFTCRRLLSHFPAEKIMSYAVMFSLFIIFASVLIALFSGNSVYMIIIPSLFMFFACGTIYPAGMGRGLSLFRHLAGSSSAVMNLVNILITTFVSYIMSLVHVTHVVTMLCIYLILMGFAALIYYFMVRPELR